MQKKTNKANKAKQHQSLIFTRVKKKKKTQTKLFQECAKLNSPFNNAAYTYLFLHHCMNSIVYSYLFQTAVKIQNDLSPFSFYFLRWNYFSDVLLFSINDCFFLVPSLLLRYTDTVNTSEYIGSVYVTQMQEFLHFVVEFWKSEFTQTMEVPLI